MVSSVVVTQVLSTWVSENIETDETSSTMIPTSDLVIRSSSTVIRHSSSRTSMSAGTFICYFRSMIVVTHLEGR